MVLKISLASGLTDNKLQRQCHNEVAAIGCKIVRQEIAGEAITMVYTKHACKQNLPDDGEDLDRENNKNRSVTRLNYSESAHFCKMAG